MWAAKGWITEERWRGVDEEVGDDECARERLYEFSEAVRGYDGYDDVPLIVCPAPCWRPICSLLPSSSTHNTTLHPNSSVGEALIRSHQFGCQLDIHCFLSVCLFVLTNCVSKGRFSQHFRKFYPLHDGPPISANHWKIRRPLEKEMMRWSNSVGWPWRLWLPCRLKRLKVAPKLNPWLKIRHLKYAKVMQWPSAAQVAFLQRRERRQ